jgi:hypothetical protein
MNLRYSLAAISLGLLLTGVVGGCTQTSSEQAGNEPGSLDDRRLPDGWVTVDVRELFSFGAPPGIREKPVQGIDSLVGTYEIGEIELHYDYGGYSSSLTEYAPLDGYTRKDVLIDGWAAELVTTNAGNLGIVFPKVPSGAKLTLYARFKRPESSDVVRKILLSIKFAQ